MFLKTAYFFPLCFLNASWIIIEESAQLHAATWLGVWCASWLMAGWRAPFHALVIAIHSWNRVGGIVLFHLRRLPWGGWAKTHLRSDWAQPGSLGFAASGGWSRWPAHTGHMETLHNKRLGSTALLTWCDCSCSLSLVSWAGKLSSTPASGFCKKNFLAFRTPICILGCWGTSLAYFSCVPQYRVPISLLLGFSSPHSISLPNPAAAFHLLSTSKIYSYDPSCTVPVCYCPVTWEKTDNFIIKLS